MRPTLIPRLAPLLVLMVVSAASAAALDGAGQSAVVLLQQATQLQRDGSHNALLRSLRRLKDPTLAPLFEHLAGSGSAALRVHGILGLAELDPAQRIDPRRVASIEEPQVQAELITAAMDSKLLPDADAAAMLAWPGLDTSVRVLIATRMVETGQAVDAGMLKQALGAETAGRRGLAALLLAQLDDPAGAEALGKLDVGNDPQRDIVRAMLLTAALRHNYGKTAGWAYGIAMEPKVDPKLGLLALRTSMRLGEPKAIALWRQRFESATDLAERTRLALTALRLSPYLDPAVFDALTATDDPMMQQIGKAGGAIATKNPALAGHVVPLLLLHHPLLNEWALDYAREVAKPEDAQLILLGLIKAYEQGPEQTRPQRLKDAVDAAELLFERFPAVGATVIKPMLADAKTDALLRKGLLLGVVRADVDAGAAVQGLPVVYDPDVRSLVTLIKARGGGELSKGELNDLGLLVRGGGNLQDSLRVQAAWLYLKRTSQTDAAVRQVAGEG